MWGLLVAYWLKHWTMDRKIQGSVPLAAEIFISLLGALSPTSKIESVFLRVLLRGR